MTDLQKLIKDLRKFNKERDWEKYHNPKDIALSISLEASELLEHFQWKSSKESTTHLEKNKIEVANELADILKYSLILADNAGIDIVSHAIEKLKNDSAKYPVQKIKGKYIKYDKIT